MTATQSEYGWKLTAAAAVHGSGVGSGWSYRSAVSPEVEWSQCQALFLKAQETIIDIQTCTESPA